jgi:chromosomal replication initiator protein
MATTCLDPEVLWSQSVERLSSEIGADADLWLRPTKALRIENQVLYLQVPNKIFLNGVKDRYHKEIVSVLKNLSGMDLDIDYEVSLDLKNYEQSVAPIATSTVQSAFQSAEFNPRYTLGSFVRGASNQLAYATAEAIAKSPGTLYNPFFLYGGVGLGKTHLLHAIGNAMRQASSRARLLYVTAEEFVNDYINAIRSNKTDEFRARYRNLECLLIDDIQFLIAKERSEEEFFHTFNGLCESRKQIVIASDRAPKDMTLHEKRLVSRFQAGQIANITPPDQATRIAILRKKAETEQFQVPDDVLLFVAGAIRGDVRILEGSLTRLKALATLGGGSLTVDAAKGLLKDVITAAPDGPVQVGTIQRIVAQKYSVDVKDLKGSQRTATVTFPRQLAMHLACKMTDLSSTDVGRAFGGRDHTTVLYSREKIQKMLDADPFLLELVNKLQADIKSSEDVAIAA